MEPLCLPIGRYGKLIYMSTDRFKSELLSLTYTVPLLAETAQMNAMVMALSRRGTVSFPTQAAINRHLDEMYSTAISTSNRRVGDMQCISVTADFLGARYVGGSLGLLPEVVSLLRELIRAPRFDDKGHYLSAYVDGEKQVLTDAIRAAINNPRGYALTHGQSLLCKGEPYALSLIGEEDTVQGLTPAALAARHKSLMGEVAPVFCYVGATPATEVVALLTEAFGDLGGNAAPYRADVHAHLGEVRRAEEEMPLSQGKLVLGFRTDIRADDPLAPALVLMNEIYGGSPASKLFMNVREKMSLCYHCSSAYHLYKGLLVANCGMKLANRNVAEEQMLAQFEDIQHGHITKTELEAAALSLANSYRSAYDSPAVLSRFYTARAVADVPETVESWREKLARVTRNEIVEAACRVNLGAVFFLKGTENAEEDDE